MLCPECGTTYGSHAVYCLRCGANLQSGPPRPGRVEYAGFWRRLAAHILDALILNAVNFVLTGVFGGSLTHPGTGELFGGLLVGWLYYALMESSPRQATLGKMALGIIVTDLNGERVSFGRASGRFWAKLASVLTLLIGYIMAGFTQKKQALHDMIAGCVVVVKDH